jgi:hypothetical protein
MTRATSYHDRPGPAPGLDGGERRQDTVVVMLGQPRDARHGFDVPKGDGK